MGCRGFKAGGEEQGREEERRQDLVGEAHFIGIGRLQFLAGIEGFQQGLEASLSPGTPIPKALGLTMRRPKPASLFQDSQAAAIPKIVKRSCH